MNALKELSETLRVLEVNELNELIDYACVTCESRGVELVARLCSERTDEDFADFIGALDEMDYDDGFGLQNLYGMVVLKDGSWLERYEYDGSECWSWKSKPSEQWVMNYAL